jgi:hypothetical protein
MRAHSLDAMNTGHLDPLRGVRGVISVPVWCLPEVDLDGPVFSGADIYAPARVQTTSTARDPRV